MKESDGKNLWIRLNKGRFKKNIDTDLSNNPYKFIYLMDVVI